MGVHEKLADTAAGVAADGSHVIQTAGGDEIVDQFGDSCGGEHRAVDDRCRVRTEQPGRLNAAETLFRETGCDTGPQPGVDESAVDESTGGRGRVRRTQFDVVDGRLRQHWERAIPATGPADRSDCRQLMLRSPGLRWCHDGLPHIHRAGKPTSSRTGWGTAGHATRRPVRRDLVVVPARGVERWLSQRLSHVLGRGEGSDGVCAGVAFRSPGSLIAEIAGIPRG